MLDLHDKLRRLGDRRSTARKLLSKIDSNSNQANELRREIPQLTAEINSIMEQLDKSDSDARNIVEV